MGNAANGCGTSPPSTTYNTYWFADAIGVIHRDPNIRDCSPFWHPNSFSASEIRTDGGMTGRVFLHETGHAAFGLAMNIVAMEDIDRQTFF